VVVDGQQVTRAKPYPDIYLQVAHLLGADPRNCIVFEDSHTGVEAARAAGARVVGLRTTHKEFKNIDLTVDDFRSPELETWLEAQEPVV
jgi:beta-phosphoglucomutase-like phosphatase (HAD superfamily)